MNECVLIQCQQCLSWIAIDWLSSYCSNSADPYYWLTVSHIRRYIWQYFYRLLSVAGRPTYSFELYDDWWRRACDSLVAFVWRYCIDNRWYFDRTLKMDWSMPTMMLMDFCPVRLCYAMNSLRYRLVIVMVSLRLYRRLMVLKRFEPLIRRYYYVACRNDSMEWFSHLIPCRLPVSCEKR